VVVNAVFFFIDIFIHSRDICQQSLKLSENARTVDVIGSVKMSKHNIVVREPKSTRFSAFNVEWIAVDNTVYFLSIF